MTYLCLEARSRAAPTLVHVSLCGMKHPGNDVYLQINSVEYAG